MPRKLVNMKNKTIEISVQGASKVDINKLVPFQGELKTLGRDSYEKLRKNILEEGFSFTIHIWKNKGKNYIIDGHQRLTALKLLVEEEGYKVPPIPVSIVKAKDFAQAKRKVLGGISSFGQYTEDSLFNYLKEIDMPHDNVVKSFSFPEINELKLEELFNHKLYSNEETKENKNQLVKSGSDNVKQIQLLYSIEAYEEFIETINKLMPIFKTENISDTVFAALKNLVILKNTKIRKKADA